MQNGKSKKMNAIQRYIEAIPWRPWWTVLGLSVYKALLDVFCFTVVCRQWAGRGYGNHATPASYLLGWLFLAALIPCLCPLFRKKNISTHIVLLLAMISAIPTAAYFGMANPPLALWGEMLLYWLVFLIAYRFAPSLRIPKRSLRPIWLEVLIGLTALTVLYVWIRYAHGRIHLNLVDVTGIRLEARGYALPVVLRYVLNASEAMLSFGLLYFLRRKRYVYVGLLAFVALCDFSIGGERSILLACILSVAAYFLMTDKVKYGYVCLLSLLVLGGIVDRNNRAHIAGVGQRALVIPARLHIDYYTFFQDKEKDCMRQGVLRRVGAKSPYAREIPFEIGCQLGWCGMRANNGLFSDAYSNFGLPGVAVYPLVLVLILLALDVCMRGVYIGLWPVAVIQFVIQLLSTTFTTALLSGGLLWIMLLFFLYREE